MTMLYFSLKEQQDAILGVAITTAIFVVIFNLLCHSGFYRVAWFFVSFTVLAGGIVSLIQLSGKTAPPLLKEIASMKPPP